MRRVNMLPRPWTSGEIEALRQMMNAGLSSGEAADELGRPRGSVMGIAHRHFGAYRPQDGAEVPPRPAARPPATPKPPPTRFDCHRPRGDGRCSADDCRSPAQHNRHGLCAEHDRERMSLLPRQRAAMREVAE